MYYRECISWCSKNGPQVSAKNCTKQCLFRACKQGSFVSSLLGIPAHRLCQIYWACICLSLIWLRSSWMANFNESLENLLPFDLTGQKFSAPAAEPHFTQIIEIKYVKLLHWVLWKTGHTYYNGEGVKLLHWYLDRSRFLCVKSSFAGLVHWVSSLRL